VPLGRKKYKCVEGLLHLFLFIEIMQIHNYPWVSKKLRLHVGVFLSFLYGLVVNIRLGQEYLDVYMYINYCLYSEMAGAYLARANKWAPPLPFG